LVAPAPRDGNLAPSLTAGAVLVLLLVLLALLRLRWLGEVAQADRQRLDAGVHAALHGVCL